MNRRHRTGKLAHWLVHHARQLFMLSQLWFVTARMTKCGNV